MLWRKLNALIYPTRVPAISDSILNEGIQLSGQSLADAFNSVFAHQSNDSNDQSVQQQVRGEHFIGNSSPGSLFFAPVNCAEVFSYLHSMKNSKTKDADGIQTGPVKYVLDIITPVVTHIYNLILSSGVFPKMMQIARVVPIYKNGDKNNLNNYRPISVLPVFSKVIEKIMHSRIISYLNKYNLLQNFQHGFRKHRSTETALATQK